MTQVLQTVRLTLDSETAISHWTDTGIVMGEGDVLRVRCEGKIALRSDNGGSIFAFPEGVYMGGTSGVEPAYNPTLVLPYSSLNISGSSVFLAPENPPFSLAIDPGATTSPEYPVHGTLRPNRDTTFSSAQLNGGGRVRVAMNRNPHGLRHLVKLAGTRSAWDIVLERINVPPGTEYDLPRGSVSPIRFVPPGLLAVKQSVRQKTTFCWFIRAQNGAIETYTSWDQPLVCPAFVEATGLQEDGVTPLYSTTPAATYIPNHAVDLTQIPTSIKLGIDAPDVEVLNLDRMKLLRDHYEGAEVEIFEVAPRGDLSERLLYLVGTLGAADVTDLRATIELTPLEELTNVEQGRRIQPFCDVGRLKGETFGRCRCRNLTALDGPDIALHTRGARIVSLDSLSKLTMAPQSVAGFTGYETTAAAGQPPIYANGFPASHGIARFQSGDNQGVVRDCGRFQASSGVLILRRALPFAPAIGDTLLLEAGCDKTPVMCRKWQNQLNFRGFEFVPGREAVRRTYQSN